ncbi:MAG TPA: allantoate amidohydrolase [Ktedonobacterales bacterium]
MMSYGDLARAVMERCDLLGGLSEESGCLTRRYGTEPMRHANEAVAGWMRAAGMHARRDHVGNLIGRYEADGADAKTLLLGSHLDTVRDAGKYDGPLGVMIALACVERLHEHGERLPFAIEVIAFADEEGLRFHTAYLGSTALVGTLDPAALRLTDADGITLAEAIRAFDGDPDAPAEPPLGESLLGYCETHIEQGPVLDAQGLPVGVVSGIQGQTRVALTFAGSAGHAGTTPMALRRDALCAAADLVLAVERYAQGAEGLVATVGQLSVYPGASNVIPGQVTLSLDVRHPDDLAREEAVRSLRAEAEGIATRRGVVVEWAIASQTRSIACSPRLIAPLTRAITEAGHPVLRLASGAGHDAAPMAAVTDVAMLFVRCAGGVSHHPAESVTADDVAVAIEVIERFVRLLAGEGHEL